MNVNETLTNGGGDVSAMTDALDALAEIHDRRREVDRLERDRIAAARAAGAPWGRIAETLGMRTRQAAEQRYSRLNEALGD
ncbi:hypothetical protein GCM10007147_45060 [Nocardiopsis kunsanensis]|uniref:AsnC family protein n=1 Tax=Nocardiopsis kunsanensis TaxID=141693 RepID=A0A919CMZ1_9ACTN|nr:hypothetical protein [Nocardiopsis kunsanensis]GHD37193.1 hypothetical protein GCM10007147_45060 [Nocardiopsis kunsanensis]